MVHKHENGNGKIDGSEVIATISEEVRKGSR